MLWLGLDGALGAFSAALVASDGSVAPRTAAADGKDALERGLTVVDEVLAGTPLWAVDALAVGTGPGGFTGLRIALSYAKSLAFATGRPLAGISSYDALEPPDAGGTFATFVHGRSGVACVRLRGAGPELVACGSYDALAGILAARLRPPVELICYGRAEGAAPALGERGIIVRAMPIEVGVPALAVVRRAMAWGSAGDPHVVVADYGERDYTQRQNAPERSASRT
jgi:tRNA threonylcarbamoyl adenosine modification protein YeaZ